MFDRRAFLSGLAATGGLVATRGAAATGRYDAVVAKPGAPAPSGPRFATLGEAFAAARTGRATPFRLWLGRGVWEEKLTLDAPDVHLIGEHRTETRIRFAAAAGQTGPDGKPWGTLGSAALRILAPGFRARDLTIENGYDPGGPGTGYLSAEAPQGQQAVALMLGAGSDRAMFERVDLIGHQDTLLVNRGRARFGDCLVSGTIDFIFGAGSGWFHGCEIRSRARGMPGATGQPDPGCIAAPSTPRSQPIGLVFDACRLTREPGVGDRSVSLGRPWRPTTTFPDGRYGDPDALGMAAFIACRMDAHIAPEGWTAMSYNGRGATGRIALQPEEARFFEYANNGPGALGARRGHILARAAADRMRAAARL
jgi:pectinesterase